MNKKKSITLFELILLGLLFFQSHTPNSEINKSDVLTHVNMARKKGCKCGNTYFPSAKPLKWNDKLEEAAQLHSDYMFNSGHYSHYDSLGNSFVERLESVGYIYCCGGENIANASGGVSSIINLWLQSEGHCRNIMNPKYTEIGLARKGSYWTMVMAKPQN